MKLEGVDPLHPSIFCVLTVAEVIGCRLRLHIDGYSECYDFWVNADSAHIRPTGWCRDTNHRLHPPKGESPLHHRLHPPKGESPLHHRLHPPKGKPPSKTGSTSPT
ncbi:lethal(3)malignant brain tumor-like protein 3, partial [Etheostoma cragini]|uniref:lethal(3)malignant brain tumor-like protein 3 n=1 Tax=Etheostoma cragini TaxID=417921 RepID=UPI00155F3A4D